MRLILLLLIVSCGHVKFDINGIGEVKPEKPQASLAELWHGRSVDEVILHPVYATKQMDRRSASGGAEILTFKNSGGVVSSGGCFHGQYASSCSSSSGEIVCTHVFMVEASVIKKFYRTGDCAEEQVQFRPVDKEGRPVFTTAEIAYYNSYEKPENASCSQDSECGQSMSCLKRNPAGEGKCQKAGVLDKLLD